MRSPGRVPVLLAVAAAGALFWRCDNVTCRTVVTQLSSSCLPAAIDADREVRIELRELCGRNCARQPTCTATLVVGTVILDVQEDECTDANFAACLPDGGPVPVCWQRVVGCKLPPLPVGDYTLRAPGLPDELLRVRTGGAEACTLPAG